MGVPLREHVEIRLANLKELFDSKLADLKELFNSQMDELDKAVILAKAENQQHRNNSMTWVAIAISVTSLALTMIGLVITLVMRFTGH